MSHVLGGEENPQMWEYGKTEVIIDKTASVHLKVSTPTICWMSHFDYIAKGVALDLISSIILWTAR